MKKKKKNNNTKKIIGRVAVCVMLAAFIVLVILAAASLMFPGRYLVVAAIMLAALTVIIGLLTWSGKGKRMIVGVVLAVIFIIISVIGCIYLGQTLVTGRRITGVQTETARVGVFVRVEDEFSYELNDSSNVYGILSDLDRETTDAALEVLSTTYDIVPQTQEYSNLSELANSLVETHESNALLLNIAYLDVLEEMEGYEDIMDRMVQITTLTVQTTTETTNLDIDTTAFTIYISGIDSREGLESTSLSDVNILATVNTETHQILLLSTPRDYYIPLSISGGQKDKLTHAGIYGIDVCMDTITMLYGIPIDYYFRLDFSGFVNIIDALGGITVYSDYTFNSQNVPGYSYVEGENYLDGESALVFCRERYAFADGDFQRGKNQLAVLQGVLQKAMSPALLTGYLDLLNSLEGSFETSIPYELIAQIVRNQLETGASWNVVSYSVGGTGAMEVTYTQKVQASVVIPDEETVEIAEGLIRDVLNGKTISTPEGYVS